MTSLTRTNPSATLIMMKDGSVVDRDLPKAFDWSFKTDYQKKAAQNDEYDSVSQTPPKANLVYHHMAVVWEDGSQSYATQHEATTNDNAYQFKQSKISEYFRECVNPGDPETDE
jgi:hypothetical protein